VIGRSRFNRAHFKAPRGVTFVKELPKAGPLKFRNIFCERNSLRSRAMNHLVFALTLNSQLSTINSHFDIVVANNESSS
jgi:hypothetical protein